MIHGVITYYDEGGRGIGGQICGANGEGFKSVVFEADTVDRAEEMMYDYIKRLDSLGPRIKKLVFVSSREHFLGSPIQIKTDQQTPKVDGVTST